MVLSSSRLLRLSPNPILLRRAYSVLASADSNAASNDLIAPSDLHRPSSIEDYVTQLTKASAPINPPSPLKTPETGHPDEVIKIPASPGWSMRAHPELYKPPILKPTHRIHVATLVIEAYNPEKDQLPLVAGFALQAAYHLGIPVTRPAAMPIKTELHTVLRSGFVHKKSQENFWRLTHRRVIKAYDSNEEVINRWVNYLRTEAVRGTNVVLNAQRFLYRPIGWGKDVDELAKRETQLEQLERSNSTSKKRGKMARRPNKQTLSGLDVSPAEAVKALAEKLVKEELAPRAEAHEAMLASTGTREGKKMSELKPTHVDHKPA